jgi:hypothetical protein
METDPKRELEVISGKGFSSDALGEGEEVALKFLGLAILYGINENAKKISFVESQEGDIQFHIEAAGKYKFPAPAPALGEEIFKVMRSITHLDSATAKEPLSLGIKNDQIELGVEFEAIEGKQTLNISFPEL